MQKIKFTFLPATHVRQGLVQKSIPTVLSFKFIQSLLPGICSDKANYSMATNPDKHSVTHFQYIS